MPEANSWTRTEQPASKICLAMECGGSDGNSGVTANPALGVAADLVVAQGGTAILGETTEIYGAEHLLTRRAVSREVGQKLVDRIKWWEWYTGVFGAQIDNNPSPGNKAGGLTTIYEKSLGALAKAGSTALVDVVPYAARVDVPGLVFMDTPGYDPPCTTGLVASGANVLVFTTGRGSVLGLKPAPCIKVATNTPMYERMVDDMDLDAGPILEGEPVESVGRRLFDMILDVASGAATKSEQRRRRRRGVCPVDDRTDAVNRSAAQIAGGRSPGQSGNARIAWLAALGVVTALELAWLGWFMIVPLPNANSVGVPPEKAVRRGLLLLKAFPEVVPDTPFRESFLGKGLAELSHVEYLPQRVPIVLTALLVALAAIGLGDLALRTLSLARDLNLGERIAVDYGLGAGLLGVATLIVGRLGWLHPWVFRGALATIAVGGITTSQLWRGAAVATRSANLVIRFDRGAVCARHALGRDAAVNRFRRARIPSASAQGVLPKRPHRLFAA